MIPIRDINPSRTFPVVVWALIALNTAVFLFELTLSHDALEGMFYAFGLLPERFSYLMLGEPDPYPVPVWATLFTHMFVHGGFLHILSNMWFLHIFGDNVEDALGHFRFAVFYLACGLAAALAEATLTSNPHMPMVGASGAIAGVMGAYLWLYPHARIVTLVPIFFFFTFVEIPAVFFLGFWFLIQILNGSGSYAVGSGGVAWWAHAGGFIAGILLILTVFKPKYRRRSYYYRRIDW